MKKTDDEIQASLAPPGAGIPLLHRLLGRYFLKPLVLRRTSFAESERRYQKAHEKFKRELAFFSPEALTVRVLVPPQKGLEDSSRYWSAAMCARHLTIVGREVEELIGRLARGEVIQKIADMATVKPELSQNGPSSIAEYSAFGDGLFQRLRASAIQAPSATFNHPWFGPMTASEWTALYSIHTYVHLEQLQAIRASLPHSESRLEPRSKPRS
jgi:hypothetical protein